MRYVVCLVLTAVALVTRPMLAESPDAIADAEATAQSWLALTDRGAYERSWDAAASMFRSSVTKLHWIDSLQSVRAPLGGARSRKIKSAKYMQSLPKAPTGEYVVIDYEADFDALSPAFERVTAVRDVDGSWKVAGYYIWKTPPVSTP
jgi:Protein of unknown function (DUF4019)